MKNKSCLATNVARWQRKKLCRFSGGVSAAICDVIMFTTDPLKAQTKHM